MIEKCLDTNRPIQVLIAVVDRFELAPVDRNARSRQQPHLSAKRDELDANLTDRRPVIFAEIGNRFVIRDKATDEPHDLNVAPALTLKPTARLNPIEINIDVELE